MIHVHSYDITLKGMYRYLGGSHRLGYRMIWRFPKVGVSPNRPSHFQLHFPFSTIHLRKPTYLYMIESGRILVQALGLIAAQNIPWNGNASLPQNEWTQYFTMGWKMTIRVS